MIQAYSTNVEVGIDSAVPFNSVTLEKGCTVSHPAPDTFNLNKCGVYMVSVNSSVAAETTIQLYKDGVAQPQAQSTAGTAPSLQTLVQVDKNNSCCPCASPTTIQVKNAGAAASTFDDVNIVITKVV